MIQYNDIEFLDYDLNYKRGYNQYKDTIIIIIQDPLGKKAFSSSGRIVDVYDNEFDHNIRTEKGSSGCPIILYTENENLIQVIGIHKEANLGKGLNSFINSISDINPENKSKIETACEAIKLLAEANKSVPNTGGLLSNIFFLLTFSYEFIICISLLISSSLIYISAII